ncbi:hypothetical protein EST38_g8145 [Candolleomyces aberdarensis]|uniref:Nucleotidyltransferase n=1 Tax=Candolleomyces aberdarensis TaxID=2316362 RepID=A0A4V1Q385_9AGAR|nr:hypothetical protein EST38_g8145 [Candolleomyces aberdarensis]
MAEAAPKLEQVPDATPKAKRPPRHKGNTAANAANKAARDDAHFALVMEAAQATVRIFTKEAIPCASFGSLATKLYGSSRCPKDVDLLIYQDPALEEPWAAEQLKKLLLDKDPRHFYLTLPRDPEATYRVLWYRQSYLGPTCKVDVLIPGTMHLPNLPPTLSKWINNVPLVPFSLLLLHKLQGWDDHRLAEEDYKRRKMPQDAADIKRLLGMEALVKELVNSKPWADRVLFSEEFEELTKRRVKDYCAEYPKHVQKWRELGFEVPDPPVATEKKKKKGKKGKKVEAPVVEHELEKEEVEVKPEMVAETVGIALV